MLEKSQKFTDAPLINPTKPVSGWETIDKDEAVAYGIGLGYIKGAIASISLTNGDIDQTEQTWQVRVPSFSSRKIYPLSGNSDSWHVIEAKSYLIVVAAILDALIISLDKRVVNAWRNFLEELEFFLAAKPPFSKEQLRLASQQELLNDYLFDLCAEIRPFLHRRVKQVEIINQPFTGDIKQNQQLYTILRHSQSIKVTNAPLIKILSRVIKRGGTALFVGATGVGKTESVKAAALAQGCVLIKIAGHPGLDDRALFGGTYPNGKGGFEFIDGPLTEAWKYAASDKKVVLLIDELARMDSYYHSIFLGAFDFLSGEEILARPRFLTNLHLTINQSDRYYALILPNGEALIAPVKNVCFMATTNLGSNYQQLTTELDPALMRRFQIHKDVERLDRDSRVAILRNHQIPNKLAQLMVELEEFSHSQTAVNGGLLTQPANIGVLLNWANEAKALIEEEGNYSWQEAILEASKITLIPFICPRNSDGTLEQPSVKIVLDEIERLGRELFF